MNHRVINARNAGKLRQARTRELPIRFRSAVMLKRGSGEGYVTAYDGFNVSITWASGLSGTYARTAIRVIHNRYVR